MKRNDPGQGMAAALRGRGLETRVLPDGYDVNGYLRACGPTCLTQLIAGEKSNSSKSPAGQDHAEIPPAINELRPPTS